MPDKPLWAALLEVALELNHTTVMLAESDYWLALKWLMNRAAENLTAKYVMELGSQWSVSGMADADVGAQARQEAALTLAPTIETYTTTRRPIRIGEVRIHGPWDVLSREEATDAPPEVEPSPPKPPQGSAMAQPPQPPPADLRLGRLIGRIEALLETATPAEERAFRQVLSYINELF